MEDEVLPRATLKVLHRYCLVVLLMTALKYNKIQLLGSGSYVALTHFQMTICM